LRVPRLIVQETMLKAGRAELDATSIAIHRAIMSLAMAGGRSNQRALAVNLSNPQREAVIVDPASGCDI